MSGKYNENSVVRSLYRNPDVKINTSSKTIEVNRNATHCGNGSWGKIDFLTNYCGYFVKVVQNFSHSISNKVKISRSKIEETDEVSTSKKSFRGKRNHINMANLTRTAMEEQKKKRK